ncbi:MFS multidrug transporter-like protein [Bimuria novae-zelandiae CBS 107.79]|uniref:MFS multidrug transporter-like protein n=1 Tax=Bimuria novae-zelandiae CBS 107.79 TaxID=1447943 RepID=A0A6A5VL54_9PLEO|nr:MFS multidrug transporter-like protein [Bimuria novae-zelandiae CBS 107.79]
MSATGSLEERAPLLRRSDSPSEAGAAGDDKAPIISTSRGALICTSVGLLIFLQGANISILTTTQSSIAADLDAFEEATWFNSSYLIAISALAPLMGRLSQLFSPRMCMFSSTTLICLGSLIISLANSLRWFLVGRALTGAGGAGILIVATIIVIQMVSAKRRGVFIGLANTGITVGLSLGAVIAGALEPRIGWKPLFGIQAPLSILAGFGILFGLPSGYHAKRDESEHRTLSQKLARIDYSGALLLIATISLFLFGLSGPQVLAAPLILSAFALPIFILNEIYVAKDPVVPITVLRSRGTLLICIATVGIMMARWVVLFYTPVYAIAVRGWAPAVAGTILIPTNAGFATGGLLAGIFHIRRDGSFYIHTLVANMLFPITLLVLAFISTPHSAPALYVLMVFCNGAIAGAALNYTLVHLLHLTLPEVHPIVLSLLATFRGFAGSFGSAIGGGIFERVLHSSLVNGFSKAGIEDRTGLIRRLLGSPALVGTLEGKRREIAANAYQDGIKTLFLCGAGLAVIITIVQAGSGWKAPVKSDTSNAEEESATDESIAGGM